jgi:hypothetical protein
VKFILAALAVMLAGCGATSDYKRATDIEADMPRAMGLGAFAPSCIFFCFTETHFTHGDDTVLPHESAIVYGNVTTERHKKTFQRKAPKPTPPPEGAKP